MSLFFKYLLCSFAARRSPSTFRASTPAGCRPRRGQLTRHNILQHRRTASLLFILLAPQLPRRTLDQTPYSVRHSGGTSDDIWLIEDTAATAWFQREAKRFGFETLRHDSENWQCNKWHGCSSRCFSGKQVGLFFKCFVFVPPPMATETRCCKALFPNYQVFKNEIGWRYPVPTLWGKQINKCPFFVISFVHAAARGGSCAFTLKIVKKKKISRDDTINTGLRSRHRINPRPTRFVSGKASEYRRRPWRHQVDP